MNKLLNCRGRDGEWVMGGQARQAGREGRRVCDLQIEMWVERKQPGVDWELCPYLIHFRML